MLGRQTWLFRAGLSLFITLACFFERAFAADEAVRLPPYDVSGLPHGKIWVPWVAAFLFAAGILALAFKNPHRSSIER